MADRPGPLPTSTVGADAPEILSDKRLELAARAAWLYHAKGQRQEDIARTLGLSRQVVQRLITTAAAEKLIRFQLLHPLASCIALADQLTDRFRLVSAEVVPSVEDRRENISSIADAAACSVETLLLKTDPVIVGIGGQRVIRDATLRVASMHRPMHRLVSLMGNMTREGRASHYDSIMGLANRVGAQCYPLPMPVVAESIEAKTVLQAQPAYRLCAALVGDADLLMTGIGYLDGAAPLLRDGFVTDAELTRAVELGAVGDIRGYCFDSEGRIVDAPHHARLTSFPLAVPAAARTIIVQCGARRVPALRAAMEGGLANGLITDEETAQLLLEP